MENISQQKGWGNPCNRESTNRLHTEQNDARYKSSQPVDMLGRNTTGQKPAEYVTKLEETLSTCHQAARDNLQEAQLRQKRTYEIKSNTCSYMYKVGDVVYKVDTSSEVGQSKKLRKPWIGPFVIVFKINNVLYRIQGRKGNKVVHRDRLKLCQDRDLPLKLKRP